MELVVPLLRTVVAVAAIIGLLWWAGRRLSGRAPSGAGLAGSGLGGPGAAPVQRPGRGSRSGAGVRSTLAAFSARLGERRPAPERALRVLERATLSPRASVALVEVGGRRLLLGVGEHGISVLDTSQVPADVPAGAADAAPADVAPTGAVPTDAVPADPTVARAVPAVTDPAVTDPADAGERVAADPSGASAFEEILRASLAATDGAQDRAGLR